MNKPATWIVRPEDSRPVGPAGHCTYCQEPIGKAHKSDCCIRQRTIVYRVTMEVVASVPADWEAQMCETHKNELSWCADNFIDGLRAPQEGCSCGKIHFEYVRDATMEDEIGLPRMCNDEELTGSEDESEAEAS